MIDCWSHKASKYSSQITQFTRKEKALLWRNLADISSSMLLTSIMARPDTRCSLTGCTDDDTHSSIVFSAKNSLTELSYDKMWSPHNWATMNKSHGLLSFNSIDAGKERKAFQDEKDASETLHKEKTHSHELGFIMVPFVWRLSKHQSSDMDWLWVRDISSL